MVPEHIMGKNVLKMNLQELREFIQTEMLENPALSIEDERCCPVCGSALFGASCSNCGSELISDDELSSPNDESSDEWLTESTLFGEIDDDANYEPFASVATPCSLSEHLKAQIRTCISAVHNHIADFIVDSLDEDGYLREPLYDVAAEFSMSVPELEEILVQVQSLDPPGIAARSLQECMLIQLNQIDCDDPEKEHAKTIIAYHWDAVSKMKLDGVAAEMGISRQEVESALLFVRERLNPYPANTFRDPWQTMAPRREAKRAPDVVIRESELGLVADVVDPVAGKVNIDEVYTALFAEMSAKGKKQDPADVDMARIKESVTSAKALLEALEFRKSSLRTVAEEILRSQVEFLTNGPAYLKPMTKKQLAQQVGLHESTISRATDNKMLQLPTGEVLPLEIVFDSALPIREMVRKLTAERVNGRPLSDGEIAERLNASGIQIARRTVAKYRDQLRLPSQEYRLS